MDFSKFNEIYSLLFNCLGDLKPDFEFVKKGEKWQSPYHLDGTRSKSGSKDQTFVLSSNPRWIRDNGGKSEHIIKWFGNGDFIKGAKIVCDGLGKKFDDYRGTPEQVEKWAKIEKIKNEILQESKNALRGSPAFDYLKNERNFNDDFIEYANFGYLSENVKKIFEQAKKIDKTLFHHGDKYPLMFPIVSNGQIYGFVFRKIDKNVDGKYKLPSGEKNHFFGIEISSYYDNKVVICEGQIDCLRAKFAGLKNVISSEGVYITKKQIEILKQKGIKHAVFLPDFDLDKEPSISICEDLESNGISSYVALFPESDKKVDIDSCLLEHSIDYIQNIIDNAISIACFKAKQISKRYKDKILTHIQQNDLKNDFSDLLLNYKQESNKILSVWNESGFNQYFDFNEIISGIEKREKLKQQKENEQKNNNQIDGYFANLEQFAKNKDFEKSEQAIKEIKKIKQNFDISDLFHSSQYFEELANAVPDGLKTNICFYLRNGEEKQILLDSASITTIGAKTGHGKSTFLRNIAVNLLKQSKPDFSPILFFSIEEPPFRVYQRMNQISNVKQYFDNNKIAIVGGVSDVSEILAIVRNVYNKLNVSAVFIDYIQLVRDNDSPFDSNKGYEIDSACNKINDFSNETSIPFVLAAQLKREVLNPDMFNSSDFSDSKSIEQKSSQVFMLWNFLAESGRKWATKSREAEFDGKKLNGQIYLKNTKARFYEAGGDCVFKFDGKKGTIEAVPPVPPVAKMEIPEKYKKGTIDFESLK